MTKKKLYKLISILLCILWMGIVFVLSHEPANDSSETSGNVIRWILKVFEPNEDEDVLIKHIEFLQPIVRKLAHFTLYMIGGILIYNFVSIYVIEKSKILSSLCGCFYAVTDEIHQLYVAGRSGELRDVAIDTAGVVTGIAIFSYILYLLKRRRFDGGK